MTETDNNYDPAMPRWEPDARSRLVDAAMALYAKRGFDDTTVAEIAKRAGLTERTFFRHFADKREVLFGGTPAMEELLVSSVENAPQACSPLEAAAAGLEATAAAIQELREFARQRHAIIAANAELRERELIKLASWSAALAEALRRRGVADPTASLTGEIAIAVFRVAFERWVGEAGDKDFRRVIRETLDGLGAATAGAR